MFGKPLDKIRKLFDTFIEYFEIYKEKLASEKRKRIIGDHKKDNMMKKKKEPCCLNCCGGRNPDEPDIDNINAAEMKPFVVKAAENYYKEFKKIWKDDERIFFWIILSFIEQSVFLC